MTDVVCNDRRKLRDALIAYMNGTILTYAFDDLNFECLGARDPSVQQVSKLLYQIHDDTVDHPISVTKKTWDALIRIVVFLDTDLAADENTDNDYWPFKDESEWNSHRTEISEIAVPSYDPETHALPVHGLLNRIPTLLGFGIIVLATGLLILFVMISTR